MWHSQICIYICVIHIELCIKQAPKLILRVNNARAACKSQDLFGEIDSVRLFLTYEVQSANSSPFISLCIVYSNIGHRAHKSSSWLLPKTAPFVCTVLTDSILCPLTSSPSSLSQSLLLSARLCPLANTLNWSLFVELWKNNYVFLRNI